MADHPKDIERAFAILHRAALHDDLSERTLLDMFACVRDEGRRDALTELTVAESPAKAGSDVTYLDVAGNAVDGAIATGNIILSTAARDVLRFEPDGKVFVRGELVDDNQVIYAAFKAWLRECGCLPAMAAATTYLATADLLLVARQALEQIVHTCEAPQFSTNRSADECGREAVKIAQAALATIAGGS